jgi:hypothetical protein
MAAVYVVDSIDYFLLGEERGHNLFKRIGTHGHSSAAAERKSEKTGNTLGISIP